MEPENIFFEVALGPVGELSWPRETPLYATQEQLAHLEALRQFLAHRQSPFRRQDTHCPFCEYGVSVPQPR
jgi:hypothetical protein